MILALTLNAGAAFCDDDPAMPLVSAIKAGNLPSVKKIIENKHFYINIRDKDGWTPIMYAAMYGHNDIAQALIDRKADIDEKDWLGWTPLMLAEYFGKNETALLLIEKGADVNARSKAGWTPLMYAVLFNRIEVGKVLITKGADINARTGKGETALSIAQEEGLTGFTELLKKAGAR